MKNCDESNLLEELQCEFQWLDFLTDDLVYDPDPDPLFSSVPSRPCWFNWPL